MNGPPQRVIAARHRPRLLHLVEPVYPQTHRHSRFVFNTDFRQLLPRPNL